MLPEAARAIEIADRHLPGTPAAQREALAKDIVQAINDYAKFIAMDTLKTVFGHQPHDYRPQAMASGPRVTKLECGDVDA